MAEDIPFIAGRTFTLQTSCGESEEIIIGGVLPVCDFTWTEGDSDMETPYPWQESIVTNNGPEPLTVFSIDGISVGDPNLIISTEFPFEVAPGSSEIIRFDLLIGTPGSFSTIFHIETSCGPKTILFPWP